MKKIITATLTLFLLTTAFAQTAASNNLAIPAADYPSAYPWQHSNIPSGVHIKAVRNCYERYGDDNKESWYATVSGYRAKFQQNGISFMADYGTKGEWLLTIKTYTENKLPKDVRARIKREYYDQQIFLVQEINRHNETVYIVSIEDSSSWAKIRLAGDEMETIAVYTK